MGIVTKKRSPSIAKRREGFTLLELLVVVGILATLVALALPYYQDYINQSRITAAQADLTTFAKAIAMYEQNEPQDFNHASLLPLVGKYIQDYRTFSGQTMPRDPWGADYQVWASAGAIMSTGPDTNTQSTDRLPKGDDLLTCYKPPFFVSSVRVINKTLLEIVFSRKIVSTGAGAIGNSSITTCSWGGMSTGFQRVSSTIFRFTLSTAIPQNGTEKSIEMDGAVITSQDGRLLNFDYNPFNPTVKGYIASFTY